MTCSGLRFDRLGSKENTGSRFRTCYFVTFGGLPTSYCAVTCKDAVPMPARLILRERSDRTEASRAAPGPQVAAPLAAQAEVPGRASR
jgi:hypothetical protein